MSTQTEHLHLDLREAADIFNPLSTNANFESLDNIIYEIQTKGGVPTYTTTASANLLKLSQNPTPNVTVFKFVAAGDANTWSYQETVNDIVALDGSKKTVKGGEMYVAWVNGANAMVVIAWPDVVNAQTFDGKGPAEWASKAQLDAVNQTAVNATTTAQAAATVANNALGVAQEAGMKKTVLWTNQSPNSQFDAQTITVENIPQDVKMFGIQCRLISGNIDFFSLIPTAMIGNGGFSLYGSVVAANSLYTVYRNVKHDENSLDFIFSMGYSGHSRDNGCAVPLQIVAFH